MIKTRRKKSGAFLPSRISGKYCPSNRKGTQNPCPSDLWGQGFVRFNSDSYVAAAPRRLQEDQSFQTMELETSISSRVSLQSSVVRVKV